MKKPAAALLLFLAVVSARAEAFFQYGFWGPFLQVVDYKESVRGVRLDVFYGSNADVTGLDIGIAHQTTGDGRGLQLGLVNDTRGSQHGLQLGLVNLAGDSLHGLQLGVGYSHAGAGAKGVQLALVTHVGKEDGVDASGTLSGVQMSAIAVVGRDFSGFQSGLLLNRVYGNASGFQLGTLNYSGDVRGVQLGLINIADSMNGLQIGLWNQINSKEHLNVLPFVNWSF